MSLSTGHATALGALTSLMTGRAPHVTAYLARVDQRLPELPNDTARRGFLGDELAKWQFRYQSFQTKVDGGEDTSDGVSAWDYLDTMGELDRRIAKLPAPVAA